jgi:hypothetical protein
LIANTIIHAWLASLFVYAAVAKLTTYRRSIAAVAQFEILPAGFARTIGVLLPYAELATAALLVFGSTQRFGAALALALGIGFLVTTGSSLLRGDAIADCGCGPAGAGSRVSVMTVARAVLISVAAAVSLELGGLNERVTATAAVAGFALAVPLIVDATRQRRLREARLRDAAHQREQMLNILGVRPV